MSITLFLTLVFPFQDADEFMSCVDAGESNPGGPATSSGDPPSGQANTSHGQTWSQVDWRAHRAAGYNAGGLQARLRRNMMRMQQQLLNQQRKAWGLPCPEGPLSAQIAYEKARSLGQALKETVVYRAGLEKANAAVVADNEHMQQLAKAIQPQPAHLPPWRTNPPAPAPPPSGQPRPEPPLLTPGHPPIAKPGQPCPSMQAPPPAAPTGGPPCMQPGSYLPEMAPQPRLQVPKSHPPAASYNESATMYPDINVWFPCGGASQGTTGPANASSSSSTTRNLDHPVGSTSKSSSYGQWWPPAKPDDHSEGEV